MMQIQNYQIPVLDFIKVHFISKIIIIISTLFVTIGIWRSAENYKGIYIWKISTKIYIIFVCCSNLPNTDSIIMTRRI